MKKMMVVLMFIMAFGFAHGETLQLGLFNPVQLVPEGASVEGVRLGLIYTKNASVKGADFNWLVSHTTGAQEGVQIWGLLNMVEGGGNGIQIFNGINYTKGAKQGVQFATININENMKGIVIGTVNAGQKIEGLEWGFVNVAKEAKGLQIGAVNFAESLDGFQIGFINIYTQGAIPVLPIVNGNFKF